MPITVVFGMQYIFSLEQPSFGVPDNLEVFTGIMLPSKIASLQHSYHISDTTPLLIPILVYKYAINVD